MTYNNKKKTNDKLNDNDNDMDYHIDNDDDDENYLKFMIHLWESYR